MANIIGYLGPKGTFSQEAGKKYIKEKDLKDVDLFEAKKIDDIFKVLDEGNIDIGIVPVENIIGGPVFETLLNLYNYDNIKRFDSILLPIEHCVGCLEISNPEDITKVISKDQALSQCSDYLKEKFPNIMTSDYIDVTSTVIGIEKIAKERLKNAIAIAPENTLLEYGFKVIDKNVGNEKNNKTIFAVIGKNIADMTGDDLTSIAIYPQGTKNDYGTLYSILRPFKIKKINLNSLHSKPNGKGEYIFFVECKSHSSEKRIQKTIESIKEYINKKGGGLIKILGSYPYCGFNPRKKKRVYVKPKEIKIIANYGGTGKMGGWNKNLFEDFGIEVLTIGRKTAMGYDDGARIADMNLLNIPFLVENECVFENIAKEVIENAKKEALIVDNCSIKTQPLEVMLKYAKKRPDLEILGMHQNFNQETDVYEDQNVLLVKTKSCGKKAEELEKILKSSGLNVYLTTIERHDLATSYQQNIEHLTNVSKIIAAKRLGISAEEIMNTTTAISKPSLELTARMLSQDPELYQQIQNLNIHGSKAREIVLGVIKEIVDNPQGFKEYFIEARDFLGKKILNELKEKAKDVVEIS
ncbi:MAG: prephenate dehydrogenase/arogenate dehydrogenase family protein [Nanoarchaeota archaeon]|nr:prephenate dehydrogenase/arogenate dehydrogenase family protein [Nanoarchaeota archaeon]